MKRAFIIGHPISHSLSPKMHKFWLDELGIEGSYEAIDVAPENLEAELKRLQNAGYVGGNVTIPHKENVMKFCEVNISSTQIIGAVNTLLFSDEKIIGKNTDIDGVRESLGNYKKLNKALILGAGGASRAVIQAVKEICPEVIITNRSFERAEKLAQEFKCKPIEWEKRNDLAGYDLLVNTTSLGMKNEPELEIDLSALPKTAIVYDIVYNPLKTKLLEQAETLGLQTIGGLWMLIYQGVPGFELWFGKRPNVSQKLYDFLASQIK